MPKSLGVVGYPGSSCERFVAGKDSRFASPRTHVRPRKEYCTLANGAELFHRRIESLACLQGRAKPPSPDGRSCRQRPHLDGKPLAMLPSAVSLRAHGSIQLLENSCPGGGLGVRTRTRCSCSQKATCLIQTRNLGSRPIPYESSPSRSPTTTNLQRILFVSGSVVTRSEPPGSSTYKPVGA